MAKTGALAKISRPRLFNVVPRGRLFSVLDENRGRPLIWISGPPGAGKTTLVASYLELRKRPVLWYQLDVGDADPGSFFLHMSQASRESLEGDNPSLPRFVPEHLADLTGFARLFFRAFFAKLPSGIVLVLDNYQETPEDAPIHGIVRQCIAEVPPDSSVIAVSRIDPPSIYIQLVASAAMVTIGWEQLQLTLDEVRSLCANRRVTDEWLLQALHHQSQGWAAGITLMLERLGHFDGKTQRLPLDSRQSVFTYFANLIFDQTSLTTRDILLSVAFLPQVTTQMAVQLSGHHEAPELLEGLHRKRLFTDRRSGLEPVYQFHALFGEFLKQKAKEALAPDLLAELLDRSARTLEDVGMTDAALEIWIEGQAWDKATQLIYGEAKNLLNSGRPQTLTQWAMAIPERLRIADPWLMYWRL